MVTLDFMHPGWLEGLIIVFGIVVLALILTLIIFGISKFVEWVDDINICLRCYQNDTDVRIIFRDEIRNLPCRKEKK